MKHFKLFNNKRILLALVSLLVTMSLTDGLSALALNSNATVPQVAGPGKTTRANDPRKEREREEREREAAEQAPEKPRNPLARVVSFLFGHSGSREMTLRTAAVPAGLIAPPRRSAPDNDDRLNLPGNQQTPPAAPPSQQVSRGPGGGPRRHRLTRGRPFNGDLRQLPYERPIKQERPEREAPSEHQNVIGDPAPIGSGVAPQTNVLVPNAPAPSPFSSFNGLDYSTWGAGHPPDTVGDVGPNHYIQTINSSVGIYNKANGSQVAAFTLNTLMSQGHFGNQCDNHNFGDAVVLYDTFEDRWVITDFAFTLDGSGNVNPPEACQCFAVSKGGDPVTGGWNYYSITITDGLNDYPKFGIWPDGIYMSANMFGFAANGGFQGTRVWALDKAQMYAGAASVEVLSFNPPAEEFGLLPANARLQTGTPPPGSPNYFSVIGQFTNAVTVYKFHVDWDSLALSTLTGPFISITPSTWASPPNTVPSQGGNNLDTLAIRLMMQNQYTNLGGVESIWNTHTVQGSSASQSAVRYYQVDVTGGIVAAQPAQAATWNPDSSNRFSPSLAVDRAGNMALGYSVSSSTIKPAIRYAGRLTSDPVNTLGQTETSLIEGTGTQVGNCGSNCTRWGDYSAMSLAPDGCTYWYTQMYYATDGLNHQTRIGSFKYPSCTMVTNGMLQGTVTAATGGTTIGGATVELGSRTTTTNNSGVYTFTGIPAGTYPGITASAPGYIASTSVNLVVTENATTTQNFSLTTSAAMACLTDTTQTDFQTGVPTNTNLTTSPGNVTLVNNPNIDQQNTTLSTSGNGISTTSWSGQTFVPAVTGQLVRADINLFCSGCTGTAPTLTVSVRATSSGLPTGADLTAATLTTSTSGAGGYFTANFSSQPTLTAGTTYALVIRNATNPSVGTNAVTRSSTSVYANGSRVTSTNSGSTWTAQATDIGFKVYLQTGYSLSGDLVSSVKDANPVTGFTATWGNFTWTASTPANTALKFQVAASNSETGPFSFVGPDGTATTFFSTSPAVLTQFNGFRYLKYKALLSTTTSTTTPTLNDVTVCFARVTSNPTLDTDGDGIPDVVEITEGTNPLVKDNDIYANTPKGRRLFVMQQYRDFLGREGDAGGITNWVNALTAGTLTRAQVIESFFNSQEFSITVAPVVRLYFAAFNRIPDYPGLTNWVNAYRAGMPLAAIAQAFATSPEFLQTYGNLNNTQYVTLLYNNVLGRAPDAGGLAAWVGALNSNTLTRGQVLLGFSESAEYLATSSNKVFVVMMYVGMLRRSPDTPGFNNSVAFLNAGNSRLALIQGFLNAPEYHNRFLP